MTLVEADARLLALSERVGNSSRSVRSALISAATPSDSGPLFPTIVRKRQDLYGCQNDEAADVIITPASVQAGPLSLPASPRKAAHNARARRLRLAHPVSDPPRNDAGGSNSARTDAGTDSMDAGARKRVAELGVGEFALRAPRRVPLPECLATCCADWPANILRQWVEVQLCYRRLAEEKAALTSAVSNHSRELQRSKSLEMSSEVHEELLALRAATKEQARMLHAHPHLRALPEKWKKLQQPRRQQKRSAWASVLTE